MNKLYEKIISGIDNAISQTLNEMAKNISYRNIDRNLWLSVASTCSKNKETDAEFIKPSGPDKMDAVKMMQRYVVALIVMNKPCPKKESDIDKLKTYKLIGHRAIELGATINDIQNCYDCNTGKKKQTQKALPVINKSVKPEIKTAKIKKEFKVLEKLIANIEPRLIVTFKYQSYIIKDSLIIKQCSKAIEAYLEKQLKKCNNDIKIFNESLRKDFMPALEIIGAADNKQYDTIMSFQYAEDDGYLLNYDLKKDKYRLYYHIIGRYTKYDDDCYSPDFLKSIKRRKYYWYEYGEKHYKYINVITEYMLPSLFQNVIQLYILYKQKEKQNEYAANSNIILRKYNMINNPSNYWSWFCNNIEKLIANNKDTQIPIYYGDWCGQIQYVSCYKGKYFINMHLESGNSDGEDMDYLSNLTKLNSNSTYTYIDQQSSDFVKDYSDSIYKCTIHNLTALAKTAFDNIKESIQKGYII